MWRHYEVQTHYTSSIVGNSWWKNLIYQICGDLDNDLFNIGIKGQYENWNKVQNLSNDHDKFKFSNEFLYLDDFFNVPNNHVWL